MSRMHRFQSLRRTLQHLALASLPAVAAGCWLDDGFDCPPYVNRSELTVDVEDSDGKLRQLVDACREEGECEQLCHEVLKKIERYEAPPPLYTCELTGDDRATLYIVYDNGSACGRRPAGFTHAPVEPEAAPVARWFSHAAALEAASVVAFEQLARELAHHGAPASLCQRAERAARDEVRHARLMGALARRFGGRTAPVGTAPHHIRPLLEIAVDNAVEGCVRESYGAAVAYYQARAATEPEVRAALAVIAEDEASHAELSWDLDRWFLARATPAERAQLAAAKRTAVATLRAEVDVDPHEDVVARTGLPGRSEAVAMVDRARDALWREAAQSSY